MRMRVPVEAQIQLVAFNYPPPTPSNSLIINVLLLVLTSSKFNVMHVIYTECVEASGYPS